MHEETSRDEAAEQPDVQVPPDLGADPDRNHDPGSDTDLLESIELGPEWGTPDRAAPRLADCTGPVPRGCRLTSRFGQRSGGWHAGQDVAPPTPAQQGVAIHAIGKGKVLTAGDRALKGHTGLGVVIRHAAGLTSYYGHLATAHVRAGESVVAGQVIGVMGFTGKTVPSGPRGTHLHLGIIVNGSFVDPVAFLGSNGVVIGKADPAQAAVTLTSTSAGPVDPAARLRSAGYPIGPDGVVEAVKAYQRTNGLLDDGDWGPVTERHYQFTRRLQTTLNQWRAVQPKLRVDGDLGTRTREALRQMQSRNGLEVTGEPDAATRAKLGI